MFHTVPLHIRGTAVVMTYVTVRIKMSLGLEGAVKE